LYNHTVLILDTEISAYHSLRRHIAVYESRTLENQNLKHQFVQIHSKFKITKAIIYLELKVICNA